MPLPFIPFIGCMEVVCKGVVASQQVFITLGVESGGTLTTTVMDNVAARVSQWLNEQLAPLQQGDFTWNNILVTDLTTVSSPSILYNTGLPVSGGIGGAATPNNTAQVVSFATGSRGRSYRGRNYVPCLPAAAMDTADTFSAAAIAAMNAAYQQLPVLLAVEGCLHVILSRFNAGARRSVGVATLVTEYNAKGPIGTQRRRVVGHGI